MVPSVNSLFTHNIYQKNKRIVAKKMENSYLTRSIKQSGWKYFEKLLSEQGRFSVFRVVKKLQNS